MERITHGLAKKMFCIPWLALPPIGEAALKALDGSMP
jgi:hypothetical protein